MNKQNWDLYKSTECGQKTIGLFEPERQNTFDAMEEMLNAAKQWGCDFQIEPTLQTVDCFYVNIAERGLLVGDLNRDTFADFIASYDILFPYEDEDGNVQFLTDRHNTFIKANDYRKKASSTHILSLCFYYFVGDLFFPILLPHRHDIFSERCSVLGIELPPVPRTKDHQQYCLYYYDLCKAIAEFRDEYNLTDAETCACIYDYASTLIDDDKNIPNLPSPTNISMLSEITAKNTTLQISGLAMRGHAEATSLLFAACLHVAAFTLYGEPARVAFSIHSTIIIAEQQCVTECLYRPSRRER